jgi:simple sugar transport system permease protein
MTRTSWGATLLTILLSLAIGAAAIMLLGYDPVEAYYQLFRGAFVGKFNIGGVFERFVPLMLTALAFAVSAKVSVFNVGVEGELYLGAMAAAWAGYALTGLHPMVHVPVCFALAMVVAGAWGAIPGALKAYWRVNEVCVTILMNYVAIFFTSYLVGNPFSARTSIPRTPSIEESAKLLRFLKPSRVNIGLFVAIGVLLLVWWVLYHTTWGFRLRHTGQNPDFSEYVGIPPKKVMVWGMILSGAIGGLAGAIEVMGIHGHFLDNFSPGIAFDGMLASLIAKNDIRMVPVLALFLAVLKTGALGMERFTGVPKTLIDTIIAVFILLAAMEALFAWKRRGAASAGEGA